MRFWVVQTGELISGIDGNTRDYRYTAISKALAQRGHETVRWASTFEHLGKRFRVDRSVTVGEASAVKTRLLHATPGYKRNISLARVRHQRRVAKMFACEAASWPRPDLILTSIPVLELAEQAVNFGNREGIPVAVDVQDLWPDLYLNAFPKCLRSIARPALWTEFRRCRKILRSASSVTAVSESYLGWALKRAGRAQRESDGCFHLSCVRPEALSNAESTECIRQELGIARDAVVVLFVGSFGASYDIATMVQAARILQKSSSNPKIHFLLAGAGEKLPKARLLADGLPNISLTGWVDQTRVEALSSTADLALCAYAREALQSIPYKAAEYLAHGLPIISSLEGDLRRLLEKERCGLFYRAGRPESLAAEITELASSAYLRSEMSARARKLFEEQFDAASVNLAWLSKLEAVARTERRNP